MLMNNSILEKPAFRETYLADSSHGTDRTDYDIAEVAIGFGQRFGSRAKGTDFGATTLGAVTFRRVDPLHEPFQVADRRLQRRLEALCETLRAKY